MNQRRALTYAILAVNTLEHPDGTSEEDFQDLVENAEDILNTLVEMRDSLAPQ